MSSPPLRIEADDVVVFAHQVGGHGMGERDGGFLQRRRAHTVLKPVQPDQRGCVEKHFYQSIFSDAERVQIETTSLSATLSHNASTGAYSVTSSSGGQVPLSLLNQTPNKTDTPAVTTEHTEQTFSASTSKPAALALTSALASASKCSFSAGSATACFSSSAKAGSLVETPATSVSTSSQSSSSARTLLTPLDGLPALSSSSRRLSSSLLCGPRRLSAAVGRVAQFVPRFHGIRYAERANGELSEYIELSDVTRLYRRPCIVDVKMGRQAYSSHAASAKIRSQREKYPQQAAIGFRFTGMKVFDRRTRSYRVYGKQYGRALDQENIIDGFKIFFGCGHADDDADNLLGSADVDASITFNSGATIVNAGQATERLKPGAVVGNLHLSERTSEPALAPVQSVADAPAISRSSMVKADVVMIDFGHVDLIDAIKDETCEDRGGSIAPELRDENYAFGLRRLLQTMLSYAELLRGADSEASLQRSNSQHPSAAACFKVATHVRIAPSPASAAADEKTEFARAATENPNLCTSTLAPVTSVEHAVAPPTVSRQSPSHALAPAIA